MGESHRSQRSSSLGRKMCNLVVLLCAYCLTPIFLAESVNSAREDVILGPLRAPQAGGSRRLEPYPRWGYTDHRIRRRDVYDICKRPECTCTDVRGPLQKNVTCHFNNEDFIVEKNDLPAGTSEFRVSGCRKFTVAPHAFSSVHNFDILHVTDSKSVHILANGFYTESQTSPAVRTLIHRCGAVTVNAKGFRVNKDRVIHVEMLDVAEVQILEHAFDYLQNATFRNISRMVLRQRSFSYQTHISSQGPTTTMLFQNVKFRDIPRETFRTAADEIRIISCDIPVIMEHAFSAMLYHSVLLLNSSIRRIDSGAFSADTQVPNLTIASCIIGDMNAGAMQGAVTGLRFVKNRIGNLKSRALKMTAVTLYFANNEVQVCEQEAFSLKQWTNITIHDNSFFQIQGSPILSNLQRDMDDQSAIAQPFLAFNYNNIRNLNDNSLSFLHGNDNVKVEAHHNYFLEKCRCELDVWLSRKLGSEINDRFAKEFQKSSYCTVDVILARCMNQPDGNVLMDMYLKNICVPTENVSCQPSLGQPIIVNDQLLNPRFPAKQPGDQDGFDFVLWVSLAVVGVFIVVAASISIAFLLCRSRMNCCTSDNRSTPASDIVAQMNTVQREMTDEVNTADAQTYQVTRTEDDGQLHPLLTNERLADLNQRWQSEDEAVRQAACEEIVKLYQTIKRQNNNDGTATAVRSEAGLYETIEDALRRPDLLETVVAVNEYALPHDVVHGYGTRSEYSEPNVEPALLSTSIPYMDATMMSDKSGASTGSGKMVNRPLPRPPDDLRDK